MKLEAYWILTQLCITQDDEKLKIFVGQTGPALRQIITCSLKTPLITLINDNLKELMTAESHDFKMFTQILWAVGSMLTVSEEESSALVITTIVEDTCVLECVVAFLTNYSELDQETLDQVAFLLYQCSRQKNISIEKLNQLKFLIDYCTRFEDHQITAKVAKAVSNIADNHVAFIASLCEGTKIIKTLINGLQSSDQSLASSCLTAISSILSSPN